MTSKYTHILPFLCDLYCIKEEEKKYKRNTGVKDKCSLPPWNLKCNAAQSKAENTLYGDLMFLRSLFYFSSLKPSQQYANEARVPGFAKYYLNCIKELSIKIYNVFLSHLYLYSAIFLINALNELYISVKIKRAYDSNYVKRTLPE